MASSWGTSWGTSWADSWGATGGAAVVTPSPAKRRKAMYPGGWIPDQLYQPQKKLKKRALTKLRKLYEEARDHIPEPLQAQLIPPQMVIDGRAHTRLPPIADVDFTALAQSLETIRVLIAAVEAARRYEAEMIRVQEEKTRRRRREEEILLSLLVEIL